MRIEDDNGLSDLLQREETRLCTGFGFTEGPVWIPTPWFPMETLSVTVAFPPKSLIPPPLPET